MSFHMKRNAVLAGIATVACAAAPAMTVDWGTHGAALVVSQAPAAGFFDDVYTFLVSGSGMLGGTVVANNLSVGASDSFLVVGGVFGLYSNPDGIVGNGDDVEVGAGLRAFDGASGDLTTVNAVQAGRYYYRVLGLALGTSGGAYQLSSAFVATPVPEPQSAALLLAGLGVLGWLVRQQRSRG